MNWGIILYVKRVSSIGPDRHEEGAEGAGLFFVTATNGVVGVGLGWEMAGLPGMLFQSTHLLLESQPLPLRGRAIRERQ